MESNTRTYFVGKFVKSGSILYIDDDAQATGFFCEAIKRINPLLNCTVASSGKQAALVLLKLKSAPDYIFLRLRIKDIQIKNLIIFIKKHEIFRLATLVVCGDCKQIRASDPTLSGADHCFEIQNNFKTFCSTLEIFLNAGEAGKSFN